MEVKRIEGKTIATEIQTKIEEKVREFLARGASRPRLVSIQTSEDPSAAWYIGQQEKLAAKLGIDFQRISSQDVLTEKALIEKVQSLSADPKVHGLFISMPLPKGFDADKVLLAMDLRKDVEGIHPASLGLIMLRKGKLIPPTAYAAFSLIKSTEIMLHGKKAVIIGQSAIVGRPLQLLLGNCE